MKPTAVSVALFAGLLGAACAKTDPAAEKKIKELSERVEKLEAAQGELSEMQEFLAPIMAQQRAEEEQRLAQEPDPEARFAVSINGNAGEGPDTAAVTIVEAFDFA